MMAGTKRNWRIKEKTLLQKGFPLDPFPKTLKWLGVGPAMLDILSAFPVAAGLRAGRNEAGESAATGRPTRRMFS